MQRFYRYTLILAALIQLQVAAYAQVLQRALNASVADEQITLDGVLSEAVWTRADKAVKFVQIAPQPGQPSVQRTEVCVLYDNNAVYIGAMLYDSAPDSILKQLSPRDEYENNNTDAFGVTFDTYLDKQNASEFVVTAAGVQTDGIAKFDVVDVSWNAAWYSKVSRNDKGWCVEMKIPYSAIRFPKKDVQAWGINFFRVIRRCREKSYWNEVNPSVVNVIGQSGVLNGVHDIVSPVRLALLPYISTYAENYSGANAHSVNGGVDIKYGINESFTIDMTVVPDFGQTIYDNKVLNLSPVEVRYDERRYFFTEGVDLFNKNDLFYSRRVGGIPVNFNKPYDAVTAAETVTDNPASTRLYNATKVSGRTAGNLGIGFFNAVSAPAYADIEDTSGNKRKFETAPLTNYNVIVLDQALKNNSYISFVNTNVSRKDSSYNADVTALLFRFGNKANTYGIDGSADVSQLFYHSKPDVGYRYLLEGGKTSGNYLWALRTKTISDRFNPNDLGYLDRNNQVYYIFDQNYNVYKPKGIFNSVYNHVGIDYYRVFNPDVFMQLDINGSHNVTLKNYLTCGVFWDAQPLVTNDYYEPRVPGRFYLYPQNYNAGAFISSDYRKKFALDVNVTGRWFAEHGRNSYDVFVSPRYQFNDKFSMIYSTEAQIQNNNVGFVAIVHDSVFFGVRNIGTITNTLDASYIFTNRISVKLDGRHYWSQAEYSKYAFLNDGGSLDNTGYSINHNINFNSFNVFMSFTWQFKPGSEMSVVYQNNIYSSGQSIVSNYFNDVNYTFQAPQSNSLSVKVIYYLDYLGLKSALQKNRS